MIKKNIRKILSTLIIIAGIIWITKYLGGEGKEIFLIFSKENYLSLVKTILMGSLAVFPDGLLFLLIFRIANPKAQTSSLRILNLYFSSQLARHLPGRFWGVVYQAAEMKETIAISDIVRVNIDNFIFVLIFNIYAPLSIILFFRFDPFLGTAFFIISSVVFYYFLHLRARFKVPYGITSILKKSKYMSQIFFESNDMIYSSKDIVKILLLLSSSYALYLCAWGNFTEIYQGLKNENIYLICATYSIAWVIGFLSMITPSGLGVREAAFVLLLPKTVPQSVLALLMVFVRLWLIIIDVVLFVTIKFLLYVEKIFIAQYKIEKK